MGNLPATLSKPEGLPVYSLEFKKECIARVGFPRKIEWAEAHSFNLRV